MNISVSYLKTPYSKEETIQKIEKTTADYLHVDLMDGLFVDDNNFTWEETWPLLNKVTKPLDIHLMTLDVEHKKCTSAESRIYYISTRSSQIY